MRMKKPFSENKEESKHEGFKKEYVMFKKEYVGPKEKYWILCLNFYEELQFFTPDFSCILEELFEK